MKNKDINHIKTLEQELEAQQSRINLLQAENQALMISSKAVLEHTSFADAARQIFRQCKKLIAATAGYVALLSHDGTENEVLFLDSGGRPCEASPDLPMPIRGLRAVSYENNQAVLENRFADSNWNGFLPAGHMILDNVLFAPLVIDKETVGVIGLANKPNGFTEDDSRKASHFAEIAAIALKNSRALEELEYSEKRYHYLFDSLNDAAFLADSQTGIIHETNTKGAELLGWSYDEIIGMHQSKLHPSQYTEEYTRKFRNHTLRGRAADYEGEIIRKDGSVVPVHISASNIRIGNRKYTLGLFRDISEIRKAMDKLSFHADILANVKDSVIATDLDGKITYWNEGAEALFGYKPEEVMGKTLDLLYFGHPDIGQTPGNTSDPEREVYEGENQGKRKDGTEVWLDIKATALKDVTGSKYGYINISHDITEEKLAQEELKLQAELLNNATDSIFLHDLDGRFIYVNDTACRTRGYTREELFDINLNQMIVPQYSNLLKHRMNELLKKGEILIESAHYLKDGSICPVEVHSHVVESRGQKMVLSVARDISERKKQEEAFRATNEQLNAIIEASPLAIYVVDKQGIVLNWNPAAKRIFGYSDQEAIGQFLPIVPPAKMEEFAELSHKVLQGDTFLNIERRWLKKNGKQIDISVSAAPLRDKEGSVVSIMAIASDITERKRAEKEIRKRITFEKTIAFIASGFVSAHSIDDAIADSLRALCELTQASRCYMTRFNNNFSTMDNVHECCLHAEPGEDASFRNVPVKTDSISFNTLRKGEPVRIDDADALLPAYSWEKSLLASRKARSAIILPLHVNSELYGFIGLDDRHVSRKRSTEDIAILQIAAGIISTALEKETAITSLTQNEKLLNTTGQVARIGGWEFEIEHHHLKWTAEMFQILETNPEQDISLEYWINYFTPRSRKTLESALKKAIENTRQFDVELEILTGNKLRKWVHVIGKPEKELGRTVKIIGVLQDITERKQYEEEITVSLKEKELLLKEIHHRVKNNMQVISSLLRLQAGAITDEKALEALKEGQERIRAMSLVYNKLHQSGNLAVINFDEYARELVTDLVRSYAINPSGIKISIEVDHIRLNVDQAIPCGLIINELIVNTLKYAFTYQQPGNLWVSLKDKRRGLVELVVGDNGAGMPGDIDIDDTKTLGLQLVKSLTEHQLGGKLSLDRSQGAVFTIVFRRKKEELNASKNTGC